MDKQAKEIVRAINQVANEMKEIRGELEAIRKLTAYGAVKQYGMDELTRLYLKEDPDQIEKRGVKNGS